MTHLSALADAPATRPLFLLEDDADLLLAANPSLFARSLDHAARLLRLAQPRLPVHLQRTTLASWLWPLPPHDVCLVAMQAGALGLDQLQSQNSSFAERAAPFVKRLPLYRTSFGAAGSGALWYSTEAIERFHQTLAPYAADVRSFDTELLSGERCAIDLLLNHLGSYTLWPPPVWSFLPGADGDSATDIRGEPRAAGHTPVHLAAHERALRANLECQEFARRRLVRELDAQAAWTPADVCEGYLRATVRTLDATPRASLAWLLVGVGLWLPLEVLVRIWRKVRR